MLQLICDPDDGSSLRQTDPEQLCKLWYHKDCFFIFVSLYHPCDWFQRIIQEMWIDLTLQGIHLTFPLFILLPDDFFHQDFYLLIGFFHRIPKVSDLRESSNINIFCLSRLVSFYRFIQFKNRIWYFPCYNAVHSQKHHEENESRHDNIIPELLNFGCLNTVRNYSYQSPARIRNTSNYNRAIPPIDRQFIRPILIFFDLSTFLCQKSSVNFCLSWMINHFAIPVAEIIIDFIRRLVDTFQNFTDHGIFHIHQ